MVTVPAARGLQEHAIEEIRVAMTRRRISARQLAEQLGWSPSGLSRRLTGQIQITLSDLEQIAEALGVPIGDLMPGSITRREWFSPRSAGWKPEIRRVA